MPADASFIDDDFFCQTKGCVVVHNGTSFEIYDVHVFATGGSVPPGQPLIRRVDNPLAGNGTLSPVITGTLTDGQSRLPSAGQGVLLGFERNLNGNDPVDESPIGDTNGFLDAEDAFTPFELRRTTGVTTAADLTARSFFITSRNVEFSISARTTLTGSPDALNQIPTLSNIVFDYGITRRGNDAGLTFGRAARRGRFRRLGNFSTLSPLANAPQLIAEFRNSIRRRADNSLAEQSIRFDYVYGFESYELSIGAGNLQYQIEFDFILSN